MISVILPRIFPFAAITAIWLVTGHSHSSSLTKSHESMFLRSVVILLMSLLYSKDAPRVKEPDINVDAIVTDSTMNGQ